MKILNRPMFRMGGPIKEGIMNGIQEPKRGRVDGPGSYSGEAEKFQGIFKGPGISQAEAAQMKARNKNRNDMNNYINLTGKAISPTYNTGPFGSQETDVNLDTPPRIKVPKYIADQDGDGIRDLNPKWEKANWLEKNVFGVSEEQVEPGLHTPSDINIRKDAIGMPHHLTQDTGASTIDKVIKKKGLEEDPDAARAKSVKSILEKLGYARSQKNALYDALIKGGQRIAREGLGKQGLVADLIADTSTSYDKPEKIREAAELMQVQQDLKLEGVRESKTNPTEEKYNFLVGKVGKARAIANIIGVDATSDDAFLRLKGLKNVTTNEAVLGAVGSMIELGEADIKKEDLRGEISKKEYKEGIGQFKNSAEFNQKGAGVYVYEGIVVQINNDGTHEIIKTFGSINDKAKKWFGLIDK